VRLFSLFYFIFTFFFVDQNLKRGGKTHFFPLQTNQLGASWDAVEASAKLDQWLPFSLFSGLFAATLVGYILLGVSDDGLD